jgi:hypothetical protein
MINSMCTRQWAAAWSVSFTKTGRCHSDRFLQLRQNKALCFWYPLQQFLTRMAAGRQLINSAPLRAELFKSGKKFVAR